MRKTSRLDVRVSDDMRTALEGFAKEDRRKLAQYVEKVLAEHIAARSLEKVLR